MTMVGWKWVDRVGFGSEVATGYVECEQSVEVGTIDSDRTIEQPLF